MLGNVAGKLRHLDLGPQLALEASEQNLALAGLQPCVWGRGGAQDASANVCVHV